MSIRVNDPVRFDGRVALVTGAARGIGAAIATRLAELGATVAAADILPEDQWQDALPADGPHTRHHLDITSARSCRRTVDEVVAAHGKLNHLVNNAGIVRRGAAATTSEEDFGLVIDVNLTGTFRMSRAAYPALRAADEASVVNMGSTNGHIAVLDTLAYCVSKAGVMHMARVLALEWAPDGIRVNAVGPTIVPTAMTEDVRADGAYMADKLAGIPLGRMAEARDVALAVAHLLSPAAAMTTGQTVFVDGGVVIH
ncbi:MULTISPECIES: SDR family NAD(P)-dependent oxidoreductase [Streptomyces]|uniref:SDR family NAD(P)-dependent oxidoreductase n=1 Tax=Streptomyces TaxID=1883 RepID=UPI0005659F0D|nr:MULTISPECIES: SDR family oxidoreductase [unclassified Streptomyces]MYR76091.1 SDR family oxidoreductase [Streptomyces sp. SID4925]MYY19967.1 SDR family oxidoreductase [Streptomyces sp. SID4912]SBU94584.1 2-deoxy-D-gluconate 3-dehydrogenase [Streptomyces sp. OspMP-M45]SCD30549.1 NAD(P)-dependent dehydrogenase, short-chain alcohol dehydrogenase family [Streptomyces sp. PpalLS-921]SCD41721.1 NAD(P)-dependent dehydrogenase, short-chain alcohol dehydrogenase family [Streptomyces sp. DpondAA-D4]